MQLLKIKLTGALLALASLAACTAPDVAVPDTAGIEGDAMRASHNQDAAAERRVRDWAMRGVPVAERELALLYLRRPASRLEAARLFELAARAGDAEAAFQLGELRRSGIGAVAGVVAGVAPDPAGAWPYYRQAAAQRHPKAALTLALMAKNGNGVERDARQAAKWLALASELGNPHAMFLLYNAYNEGLGVPRDAGMARKWLEESAEHEYPPALQELAMALQAGAARTPGDELRAGHLLKEATEHRHNNWNRF